MTEPSDAAKAKADELLGEWMTAGISLDIRNRFATFIQQVSDAAKGYFCNGMGSVSIPDAFTPFILPEPVDPFMDFLEAQGFKRYEGDTRIVHKELAKRGLKIVEASHD